MEITARDKARELFKQSGLTYEKLTRTKLQQLRNMINESMKKSGYMDGTLRCKQRAFMQFENPRMRYAGIRCRSFYFDDREAVSFNPDGFVGFAGWSDNTNIKPILDGFTQWVKESTL